MKLMSQAVFVLVQAQLRFCLWRHLAFRFAISTPHATVANMAAEAFLILSGCYLGTSRITMRSSSCEPDASDRFARTSFRIRPSFISPRRRIGRAVRPPELVEIMSKLTTGERAGRKRIGASSP